MDPTDADLGIVPVDDDSDLGIKPASEEAKALTAEAPKPEDVEPVSGLFEYAKGAGAGLLTGAAAPVGLAPKLKETFEQTRKAAPMTFGASERVGQLGSYALLSRLGAKVPAVAGLGPATAPALTYIARETPEAIGAAIEAGAKTRSLADMLKAAGISYAIPGVASGVAKAGKGIATTQLPEVVRRGLDVVPGAAPVTSVVKQTVGRGIQALPTVAGTVAAPIATAATAETPEEFAASLVDVARGGTALTRGALGKVYERQAAPLPAKRERAEAELLEKTRKPIGEAETAVEEARMGVQREQETAALEQTQARVNLERKIEDLKAQRGQAAADQRETIDSQLATLQRKRDNIDTTAFRKYEDTANADFIRAVKLANKAKATLETLAAKPNPLARKAADRIAELQQEKEGARARALALIAQQHLEQGGRLGAIYTQANALGVERPTQFDPDLQQIYNRRVEHTDPKMRLLREYWSDAEGTIAKLIEKDIAKIDAEMEKTLAAIEKVPAVMSQEERDAIKRRLDEQGISKLSDEEHARLAADFGLQLPPTAIEQLRTADLRFKTQQVRGRLGGLALPTADAQQAVDIEADKARLARQRAGLAPEAIDEEILAERTKRTRRMEEDAARAREMRRTPSAAEVALQRAERGLEAAIPQPVSTMRPPSREEEALLDVQREQARRRIEGLSGVVRTPSEAAARRFNLEEVRPAQASLGLAAAEGARLDPRISGKVTGGWLRGILSGSITDPAQARTFLAQTADRASYGDPAAASEILKAFEAALSRGAKNAAQFRERATKTNIVRAALEALGDPEMKELMAQEMAAPTPAE